MTLSPMDCFVIACGLLAAWVIIDQLAAKAARKIVRNK